MAMEGRPRSMIIGGMASTASTFASTHQVHAHGFKAAIEAQEPRRDKRVRSDIGSQPVAGGGAKQRERALRQIHAGQLKADNGLV